MEMEINSLPAPVRNRLQPKVRQYKAETEKSKKELVGPKIK